MVDHNLFYVRPDDITETHLYLQQDELHHLTRVLRHGVNDSFMATDGEGHLYTCRIEEIHSERLLATIENVTIEPEASLHLTLGCALIKRERFEWLLEKSTELGIDSFQPLLASRSTVPSRMFKMDRFTRILIGAMKQCGAASLPKLMAPTKIDEWNVDPCPPEMRLIAHEKVSSPTLSDYLNGRPQTAGARAIVLIGPEGGFTEAEVADCQNRGFTAVSLGPRRLRSETAALVATSLLLSHCRGSKTR